MADPVDDTGHERIAAAVRIRPVRLSGVGTSVDFVGKAEIIFREHHISGSQTKRLYRLNQAAVSSLRSIQTYHPARHILRAQAEAVLAQIDPDQRNRAHDGLPKEQSPLSVVR